MQRYDSYKDSGIQWLGEIPSHWEVSPLKYAGKFRKGKLPKSTNENHEGLPIIGASEMSGNSPSVYTTDESVPKCNKDDILLLWDGANAGLVSSNHEGIVASTVTKFSNERKDVDSSFLYYLEKNYQRYYKERVGGTTIPHMNNLYIADCPLLIPSIEEQQAIASYLDTATAKIDEAIAQQQKMIDLLNERKQIIIINAVTKGLNPNAKMKPSGIDWIGNIPEHWEVNKLKNCAKTNSGSTPRSIAGKENPTSTIRWVRTTDLHNNIVEDTSEYISEKEMASASCPWLPQGTVLISMYGGSGSFGKVGLLNIEATINQALCSINCNSSISPMYMFYYLQSVHRIWMKYAASSRKDPNLNQETIRNLDVVVPPLEEQECIINAIQEKLKSIGTVIEIFEHQMLLLQERKQIIINDVVTGKVKV